MSGRHSATVTMIGTLSSEAKERLRVRLNSFSAGITSTENGEVRMIIYATSQDELNSRLRAAKVMGTQEGLNSN